MNLSIRPMVEGDRDFILSSWLKSFKNSRDAGPISMKAYWPAYTETITELLGRSDVLVATPPDSDLQDAIHGYIVVERGPILRRVGRQGSVRRINQDVLHWVYVKELGERRGKGIARALFTAAGLSPERPFYFTFRTSFVRDYERSGKEHRGEYDNSLARYPKTANQPPEKTACA